MVNVETTIYTGSVRRNSVLHPVWGEYYIAPCAWGLDHEVCSSADLRSPALLYIVLGAGFLVGYKIGVLLELQGSNATRITYGES
jgi:hypothetical protein